MSTMSLRLPDSIHRHIKEIAKREGVSINQLITTAVTEKVSALLESFRTPIRRLRKPRRGNRRFVCASEKRCTGNFGARTGLRSYNSDVGRWLNRDPIVPIVLGVFSGSVSIFQHSAVNPER